MAQINVNPLCVQQKEWATLFRQTSISTCTQSVSFIKKLTAITFSTISFLRGMFPSHQYDDRTLDGRPVKILRGNSQSKRAFVFITWIKSAFQAIEKKYMREFVLEVCNEESEIIEFYKLNYSYDDGNTHMSLSQGSRQKNTTICRMDEVHYSTAKLMRSMSRFIKNLKPLPEKFLLQLRITYYDEVTPTSYQPKFFYSGNPTEYSDKMSVTRYDNIHTKYHSFNMESGSLLISEKNKQSDQVKVHMKEKKQIYDNIKTTQETEEDCIITPSPVHNLGKVGIKSQKFGSFNVVSKSSLAGIQKSQKNTETSTSKTEGIITSVYTLAPEDFLSNQEGNSGNRLNEDAHKHAISVHEIGLEPAIKEVTQERPTEATDDLQMVVEEDNSIEYENSNSGNRLNEDAYKHAISVPEIGFEPAIEAQTAICGPEDKDHDPMSPCSDEIDTTINDPAAVDENSYSSEDDGNEPSNLPKNNADHTTHTVVEDSTSHAGIPSPTCLIQSGEIKQEEEEYDEPILPVGEPPSEGTHCSLSDTLGVCSLDINIDQIKQESSQKDNGFDQLTVESGREQNSSNPTNFDKNNNSNKRVHGKNKKQKKEERSTLRRSKRRKLNNSIEVSSQVDKEHTPSYSSFQCSTSDQENGIIATDCVCQHRFITSDVFECESCHSFHHLVCYGFLPGAVTHIQGYCYACAAGDPNLCIDDRLYNIIGSPSLFALYRQILIHVLYNRGGSSHISAEDLSIWLGLSVNFAVDFIDRLSDEKFIKPSSKNPGLFKVNDRRLQKVIKVYFKPSNALTN